jgi:hypothetical protein
MHLTNVKNQLTDRDGKSKTASAVDAEHYPEQNEVASPYQSPAAHEIALRAHELWVRRGRPEGSSEADWFEAERELKESGQGSGSVQK